MQATPARLLFVSLITTALAAQGSPVAQGIDPVGRVHPAAAPLAKVPAIAVPAIDRQAIELEDELRHQQGLPARFAIPNTVQAAPLTHGLWEALDGSWSLWRLRIQAPESSHVNLGFRDFVLPDSARLMVYSSDYSSIVRPFVAADRLPTGELWTPVVDTEEIVVEVYVPTTQRQDVRAELTHVGSGYRFFGAGATALGLDGGAPCQVDVTCPVAAPWVKEIPAVAIMTIGGSSFCTGAMVNNTAQDGRNFFLTAHHCGVTAGLASSLIVYWNYQKTTCGGGGAVFSQFTAGSQLRASHATSDFTLLELNSTPNVAWGVSYLGWNRSGAIAASAAGIHHPSGAPKKISIEYQSTQVTSYGGVVQPGAGTHIRVVDWDVGVTEPGSSGSPLLDADRRVIGQLHGGASACGNNFSDWYGRLAYSWIGGGTNATRLMNWLDPLGTNQPTIDTWQPLVAGVETYGTGCYTSRASFQETFGPSAFDLGGTAVLPNVIAMVPTANGYTVQQAASTWFVPQSPNIGLGDNALALRTLPFSFPYPGGSTTVVQMCSNGFVWLNGTSTATENFPNFVFLANGPARFAPLWMDLNPAAGGTCHYDVDPSGNVVYFTWSNVPPFAGGAGSSVQLALFSNGLAEYRYGQIGAQPSTCLVGYTRGQTLYATAKDLSASLPFAVGPDSNPPTWNAVGRPVVGTTQTINLGGITNPASSIGLTIIGWNSIPAGFNLAIVGAPDCFLWVQNNIIEAYLVGGVTAAWQLPIPANPALSGVLVFTQGGLLQNGVNPLGLLTTNAVKLTIGTQ
jgi:hypothetical protein